METKLSTKGQVVLPGRIRNRFGLRPGDPLDVSVEKDRIILTPRRTRRKKARVIKDPATGFPVIDLGPDAPTLTSEQVAEILADFP
jgi:AbrB family looped-hinge helix DNA binding protein